MKAPDNNPIALITGAAVRLGATTARLLHSHGYNIVIHCNRSLAEANALCEALNQQRSSSAIVIQADLSDINAVTELAEKSIASWGRLNVLINNASAFYPTPLDTVEESQWQELFASNAKAPLFLAQICAKELKKQHGSIINISDLYAKRGRSEYSIYTMAKAALEAMTRSLALELAPEVRINGIAPGAILAPPGEEFTEQQKQKMLENSSLKKMGKPSDIANTILFLIEEGSYITGQTIHVDGGR